MDDTFVARFHRIKREKKLSDSMIARRIWGEYEEERTSRNGLKYKSMTARNRQAVMRWSKGLSYPSPEYRQALADACGVAIADLFPDDPRTGVIIGDVGKDGRVLLEISMRVPPHIRDTVVEILERYRR